MKLIFITISCLLFINLTSQELSDYKYIALPEKFSDFDKGQYQLENYLRLLLTQKGYEALSEIRNYWPEEALLNPCLVLHSDVQKEPSAFKNKLKIIFKDCNQAPVLTLAGESGIKDFSAGYKDAMKDAMSEAKQQAAVIPEYRETESQQVTIVKTTENVHPGTELFKKYSKLPVQQNSNVTLTQTHMTAYESNGILVYKTDLQGGEILLTDDSQTKILAHFYPATKPGIYHVKANSNNTSCMTIGYVEADMISYEYSDESGKWLKIEFIKK